MMIELCAKIVFKKISSDDDTVGYDDARTCENREVISDDDTVGFSLSDTPSGGGRSGQEVYQSSDFIDGESEAPSMKKAPHMTPLSPPSSNVPLKMSGGCGG